MENIIELNNVSFSAQEGKIVQDITVKFNSEKITAIVGPSGCGKSTVLKLSAGLLVPNQGEVYYKEKNIAHMNRSENLEYRRDSAFVFQDSALWANQNLYQILELPLRIHYPQMNKKQRAERIKEVTGIVGYKKELDIRPSRLSMGEQKLIGFARALLCNPSLLYLDEWTESLDETAADRLIGLVKQKKKEGATVLFVCHDMRIIKDIADYVVILVEGKVVFQATKEDVMNDPELSNYIKMRIAL
ncbi:MAG: ATP-binding cassette domain-containing protein [Treponema sp.]|nr:ATP-binding cassette domain-containing protein [Treponema sp.]MCL2250323.1 ATP-binding cassette domain-containing protein [Treponema sp.]